jgi:orotidine-5'-phosphate decarboxylase
VKIGNQLFTAAGPTAVEHAHKRGCRVFLDLKYHDIPNTVAGAVREATRLGVFMLDVHASGGFAMMRAAADAATKAAAEFGIARPLVTGVTVLTSLDRKALPHDLGVTGSVEAHVLRLAERARDAGLDGCVASPREIGLLRGALGPKWVIVTPGVRPEHTEQPPQAGRPEHTGRPEQTGGPEQTGRPEQPGGPEQTGRPEQPRGVRGAISGPSRPNDDQMRTATPRAAISAGANYLVVGRPITAAPDPVAAVRAVLDEIASA